MRWLKNSWISVIFPMEAYAVISISTCGMLKYKQGGALETRTCRIASLPENFHAGHVTGYEAQVFGWLLSGFTSHSKVIKSQHLKDWRSQGLNHLPSITNLAYAKPFLKLPQIQEKRANVVHLSQRIPHLITCIYGMEALRLTPAENILHPATCWQSHGLCDSEFQGCAVNRL